MSFKKEEAPEIFLRLHIHFLWETCFNLRDSFIKRTVQRGSLQVLNDENHFDIVFSLEDIYENGF